MNSQINVEGISFERIEDAHMAEMTSLEKWAGEFATRPVTNELEHLGICQVLKAKISDMQSYLATLEKDFPRESLGLHGPAYGFAQGIEAAAS